MGIDPKNVNLLRVLGEMEAAGDLTLETIPPSWEFERDPICVGELVTVATHYFDEEEEGKNTRPAHNALLLEIKRHNGTRAGVFAPTHLQNQILKIADIPAGVLDAEEDLREDSALVGKLEALRGRKVAIVYAGAEQSRNHSGGRVHIFQLATLGEKADPKAVYDKLAQALGLTGGNSRAGL